MPNASHNAKTAARRTPGGRFHTVFNLTPLLPIPDDGGGALPAVRVEQDYVFDAMGGKQTLADLFQGNSQLIVYHFMLGPGEGEGCPGCSFLADSIGNLAHLHARDTTLVFASRAPQGRSPCSRKPARKVPRAFFRYSMELPGLSPSSYSPTSARVRWSITPVFSRYFRNSSFFDSVVCVPTHVPGNSSIIQLKCYTPDQTS